jgi:signal transduction histidine kinase
VTFEAETVNPQHAESWHGAALGEVWTILDELVATHHQTVRQERLRAFREMAGEVAHDFNNTLSSILVRAQLMLAEVRTPTCAARGG